MLPEIEDIEANFSFLEDWEDKYRYLIELGEGLAPFPDAYRTEEYKVDGCMSQVWLYPTCAQDGVYTLQADSDALIVKGLIAIILSAYSGKNKEQIKAVPIEQIFENLGLATHLSPTRRNGFFAMVEKIRRLP
ncbi:MAG: SufE family protein [Alphaproteobacteria bacterium]|nr:SufE family protein [Alphaproteobacteria bacterium]